MKRFSKFFLMGMLALVLVFGFVLAACKSDSGGGDDGTIYDPNGIWDFSIHGTSASVSISGTTWIFYINGRQDDSGTFNRSGNTGTLYSNTTRANIGTATMTSNSLLTLRLYSPSYITGTFIGNRR